MNDLSHVEAVRAQGLVGRLGQIGQQVGLWGRLVVELAHGLPAAITRHAINDQHGGALRSGLGRVRLGAGRLGLLVGALLGSGLASLGRLGRLEVQDDELAGVLGAAFDLGGYADGLQHIEALAGCPHFVEGVLSDLHRHERNAEVFFAIGFVTEEQLDQFHVVELDALSADECQFHSGACHVVFPRLSCALLRGFTFCGPS
ncbi:conserved protein of unknown function [Ectopseudomonas oleovorans]|nr:conserved protein of unknown function [Pseudomonas oleovorans]